MLRGSLKRNVVTLHPTYTSDGARVLGAGESFELTCAHCGHITLGWVEETKLGPIAECDSCFCFVRIEDVSP